MEHTYATSTQLFINTSILILKTILTLTLLNSLNGLVYLPFLRVVHYQFWGYQDVNLKLASQQCRPNVQAELAQYWWQRLIMFPAG